MQISITTVPYHLLHFIVAGEVYDIITLEWMMYVLVEMTNSHFQFLLDESSINKPAFQKVCYLEYRSPKMVYEKPKRGLVEDCAIK